jgi:hypothetical protein
MIKSDKACWGLIAEINMRIRIYVLSLLAFAMGSYLLLHFGLIWVYGKFYIYESSLLVLVLETALMVGILAFSFYCLVEQIHTGKMRNFNQKIAIKIQHKE